jgi:hypothetical protein
MSNLSDYTTGLDDTVWTDARAAELDTAMSTSTWTNTRAGYLDVLAGGSLGFKPVQTYFYGGAGNGNVTVSITDWEQCLVVGSQNTTGSSAMAYRTTSNTNVTRIGFGQNSNHCFVVTRFG